LGTTSPSSESRIDSDARPLELHTAIRNRYFYGKLLDVVHFEIEQDYFNYKRWVVNRLVLGYGVVCGLDVQLRDGARAVVVTKGFAIDRWGREIVVASESHELELPEAYEELPYEQEREQKSACDDDTVCYHLVICYHECGSSPEPALGDECGAQNCVPSLVQERYRLEWRPGKAPEPPHDDCLSHLISGDRVNRRALALHVSQCCPEPPAESCLPLANVRFPRNGDKGNVDVDISVRPIVYTNDLLFELITAMSAERQNRPRGGK
jgi:hypothetical protein